MNIKNQIKYILCELNMSIKFRLTYFLEKFMRFFLITIKKIFNLQYNIPYIFQNDYVIRNNNWIWKIKAKSDYDFTINTYTEKELEKIFVMDDGICIDIGAHIGKWSIFVARQWHNKKVYSFEPNPTSYQYLQQNIRLNKLENQILPFQLWIWDKKETLNFLIEEEMSSVSHFSLEWNIKVDVVDLTSFIKQHKIDTKDIRIIKIDTEWFEDKVFWWMQEILPLLKNVKIICELLPNQKEYDHICTLMKDFWFKKKRVNNTHNYVFIK